MKKNNDPNKVSNFKNYEPSYHKHSTFCMKTKPNKRYFKGELKRLTQQMRDNFCTEELKKENPAHYYSMMGQKLPKKYQEKPKVQIAPVNAYVPSQSKLSKEELELQMKKDAEERKIKEQKAYEKNQLEIKEKQRREYNQATFNKQQSLVFWCDAYEQGNYRSIHSEEYKNKTKKNYEYY
jgi:hypothetical protein